jgi:hypothetical protein
MMEPWRKLITKYDGTCCLCGRTIRARKHRDIAHGGPGRSAHWLCYVEATTTEPLPDYVPDESRPARLAERAALKEKLSALLNSDNAPHAPHPQPSTGAHQHHPDCDAQIPGNPCTCHYEER